MDKQLTSPSKQAALTQYKYGVKFTVKTPDQEYEIDGETAQKLSDVLVSSDPPKFIKFKTEQGLVVLNIASIMGISLDEKQAKELIAFMKKVPSYGIDYSDKEKLFTFYRGNRLSAGNHYAEQQIFNYYYDQEFGK